MPTTNRQSGSIAHPSHTVPDEITATLKTMQEIQDAEQSYRDEFDTTSKRTEAERNLIAELRSSTLRERNPESIHRLKELERKRVDRIKDLVNRPRHIPHLPLPILDLKPNEPGPTDPTFWWARTDWHCPGDQFFSGMDQFGVGFSGSIVRHAGTLHKESLQVIALFALSADRIPSSLNRRWISAPHVEIFGTLSGNCSDNWGSGDQWSKCWAHRDQQIFQWQFGQNGPAAVILGQAHESENLWFMEDEDRTVHVPMKGFQLMPSVSFTGINPLETLWARLEVRFDFQTEGAGTGVSIEGERGLKIRTVQWPLGVL